MSTRPDRRRLTRLACAAIPALLLVTAISADQPAPGRSPVHARTVSKLLIRNAMVIYGNAKPAFGPVDILVQDGLIARVGRVSPQETADAVIDATGKYVMPGLINAHVHLQDERGGVPQPFQYEANLWLACGITTVRDVGSPFDKAKAWREASAAHTLVAPRILIYTANWRGRTGGRPETVQTARDGIRWAKENGADGIKFFGIDRDLLESAMSEVRKLGMRSAAHIAVEETTARDFAELGTTSIEHFYGVADAALDGIQDFPASHNANNEAHRFGRAGELYLQRNLNRDKLSAVLDLMVERNVAWVPTLSIYVAARDVVRAQMLPWYTEYLHPTMEEYWKPDLQRHGSFFLGWTNTQETRWKRSYRVWMDAVREFANKGGLVAAGDDAGFIYSLYGFGLIHELELLEEAGFHPLEVIRQATANGAALLGLEDRLGRVRPGYIADLLVVNGNPLENLHLLNPYGTDILTQNGRPVSNDAAIVPGDRSVRIERGGGIEWTIKDGIPYHVPTLMKETREMVASARAERARNVTKR